MLRFIGYKKLIVGGCIALYFVLETIDILLFYDDVFLFDSTCHACVFEDKGSSIFCKLFKCRVWANIEITKVESSIKLWKV